MKPDPHSPKHPAKKSSGKVFDVQRPGRARASSTSKPVISYQPVVKDPDITINGVGEARELLDSRQKISLTPTDGDLQPSSPAVGGAAAAQDTTAAARIRVNRSVAPAETPATGPVHNPNTATVGELHGNEVFSLGDPATAAPATPSAPATAPPQPVAPLQTVEQTQGGEQPGFVVSQHDKQPRNSHTLAVVLLLLLMLLLAAAAVDILLDANMLHLSGVPHTDLLR